MSDKIIKIFAAEDMQWTPFQNNEKKTSPLLKSGVLFTQQARDCDVLIAKRLEPLRPFVKKYGKKKGYLIWSSEPRGHIHFKNTLNYKGVTIHVINVYTGDSFVDNLYEFKVWRWIQKPNPLGDQSSFSRLKNKKIVALLGYRPDKKKWSLMRDGKNIDLSVKRTELALRGHELGKMDVFGKGWPKDIALEDSRFATDWRDRKRIILSDYSFNVAMENTNADYYCTEKIWDSIQAGCLPIYWGKGNKIYEDFPKNSFLDYADFDSPEALFEYIDKMKYAEFRERFNCCAEVCNRVAKEYPTKEKIKELRKPRMDHIMAKLHLIMESQQLDSHAQAGGSNSFLRIIISKISGHIKWLKHFYRLVKNYSFF